MIEKDYLRIDGFKLQSEFHRDGVNIEEEISRFIVSFESLVKDPYMPSEFGIRKRRFGRFYWNQNEQLLPLEGTTFVQSIELNSVAGGIQREFAPLEESFKRSILLKRLIGYLARTIDDPSKEWNVNVHQFRVESNGIPASAAPEGIHRDGHNFVAIVSLRRHNIEGGFNRIYDDQKNLLFETLLSKTFDTLLIHDLTTFHDVTPFQSPHNSTGYRDTLVIDFNSL